LLRLKRCYGGSNGSFKITVREMSLNAVSMCVSVIICTHNPRSDYLRRVLDALKASTLPMERWELLLIDNASSECLADAWDLSWHPYARHIREDELGLTAARLRGITESAGQLLVFVDDDNVLSYDYLETAITISRSFPQIAAFGGSSVAEYEEQPPAWFFRYPNMPTREIVSDRWSNNPDDSSSTPIGAGMIVTRPLGFHYVAQSRANPLRKALDRCGTSLSAGGDIDLALMSCDIGFGKGVFKDLTLTHLIPASRLKLEYLLRLNRSMAASIMLRNHLRGDTPEQLRSKYIPRLSRRILNRLRVVQSDPIERKLRQAWDRGVRDGIKHVSQLHQIS
jgi:glycosyltransferase involved in cell wall biosynthesis